MDRKEALKQLALLTGGTLSFSTMAAVMSGCRAQTGDFTPQTLTTGQNQLVTVVSERIIPATDTPGAKAAGVNRFIDHMLTNWNTEEERNHFLEGLDYVDVMSQDIGNAPFLDLDREQQILVLEQLEKESREDPEPVPGTDLDPFFHMMKEFTLVGYYTSEIGAARELKSNLVPGRYEACIPYSEIGRAWSGS